MPPFIPIVIGITGKRELGDKETEVRRALDETLAEIEKRFPNSPLVLATGLAKGADLLAAKEALKRPLWSVVGVLPFSSKLFLEDFRSPEDAKWREWLFDFLPEENPNPSDKPIKPNPRFIKKVLKPLRKPEKSNERFTDADLHRTEGNLVRRQHYEQVGLVIADRCTLLIAVMPGSEEPGKVGGTARIAQYKRTGRLDQDAWPIARDSEEIAPPELLDCELKGLVREIDLDRDDQENTASLFERFKKKEHPYAWMTVDAIDRFNAHVRKQGNSLAPVPFAHEVLAKEDADKATDYISRLRNELSKTQRRLKKWLTRAMLGLAALFVVSVTILEVFAKLHVDKHELFLGYVLLVAAGLFLFHCVRKAGLSAYTEDYRGAAEAMRIQMEWWRLGLRAPIYRVDRYYFVGGEGHFSVLRGGIKAALDAATLLSPVATSPGVPLELESEKKDVDRFWLPGQIKFFRKSSDARHRSTIRVSSLAWYLFQMSAGVGLAAGGLMLLLPKWRILNAATAREWVLAFATVHKQYLPLIVLAAAILWAVLFLIWVRAPQQDPLAATATHWDRARHWLWYSRLLGTRGTHSGKHGWALALIIGALMVPALLAMVLDQGYLNENALEKAEKYALVLMIVLASCSGAMRFVLERRVLEAEAVSYREALQRFMTAKARALETRESAKSAPVPAKAILEGDQKLGFELGKLALAENEAWLRAHRQRPIEPVG